MLKSLISTGLFCLSLATVTAAADQVGFRDVQIDQDTPPPAACRHLVSDP